MSIIYKQNELGRIVRHSSSDGSEASHSILNRDLKKVFILRKSFQLIPTTSCFNKKNRKIDNGYNILQQRNQDYVPIASLSDSELKINRVEKPEDQIGLFDKILLFATLVSIVRNPPL